MTKAVLSWIFLAKEGESPSKAPAAKGLRKAYMQK